MSKLLAIAKDYAAQDWPTDPVLKQQAIKDYLEKKKVGDRANFL